jgi:hypothetical protein
VRLTEPEPEPDSWSAIWARPVATDGATLVAHRGRTIPVKVELFADGVEQTSGRAWLSVAKCDGTTVSETPLTWRHGRWTAHLHTARLRPGCYVVTATLDGHAAGSFRLDVRGHACAARRH